MSVETATTSQPPVEKPTRDAAESLGRKVVAGGIALTGARVFAKTLGTVRQLILPRWLGPEQMGIFGVAMLAISAIEALSQPGLTAALIQKKSDYAKYIAPVRTVQALRGLVICCMVVVAAPWLAAFFESPKSVWVIRAVALLPLVQGLEPLFNTLASRNLQFLRQVKLQLAAGMTGLLASAIAAYFRPTALALVIGTLSSAVVVTVGAHFLSEHGRGFSLRWGVLRDLQAFGFWMFLAGLVSYAFVRLGEWAVGHMLDVRSLAVYQIALWFATVFTAESAFIINQVVFPVFARMQNDIPRLQSAFRRSFGLLAIVVCAAGAVACVSAGPYHEIVLGAKWGSERSLFVSLVPAFAIWGVCSALSGAQSGVFQALGRPQWLTYTVAVMTVILAALVSPVVARFGSFGAAVLLASVGVLMQLVRCVLIGRLLKLRLAEVLSSIAWPVISGMVAVALTSCILGKVAASGLGLLLIAVTTSMLAYSAALGVCGRFMQPSPVQLFSLVLSSFRSRRCQQYV